MVDLILFCLGENTLIYILLKKIKRVNKDPMSIIVRRTIGINRIRSYWNLYGKEH